jgi:hypothetical protein
MSDDPPGPLVEFFTYDDEPWDFEQLKVDTGKELSDMAHEVHWIQDDDWSIVVVIPFEDTPPPVDKPSVHHSDSFDLLV